MIDADHATHALSNKVNRPRQERGQPSRLAQHRQPRLPARSRPRTESRSCRRSRDPTPRSSDAIRKAIAQARSAGGYDLVILDGPAMPWSAADRKLLDVADGLVAMLPASLDINDCMEDIIAALGGAEHKLVGVVLNELQPAAVSTSARQTICLSAAQIRSAGPPPPSVPRISLGGLAARRARYRADREFHDRHGVPGTPGRPPAVSDLRQWRGAGALFDRADDRAAVPRRRSHQCRRPAAGHGVAAEINDAAAGARRDHRPVRRRRPQGRGGGTDLLYVRRR